jgi:hypothetical protein
LKANLEILVEAVDVVYESGSVSVPMLQIDKVLDLQLVVGNIKMYKNKVPYLASPEVAIIYPKLEGCQIRYNCMRGFGGSLHRCQENGS